MREAHFDNMDETDYFPAVLCRYRTDFRNSLSTVFIRHPFPKANNNFTWIS